MKKRSNLLLTAFFILWLFAVFGGFYLVQKPFTPAVTGAMANVLLDLLVAGWIGALGLSLGHRLLCWLQQLKSSNLPTLQPFGLSLSRRPPAHRGPLALGRTKPSNAKFDLSSGEVLILGSGLGLGALGLLTLGLGLAGLFYRWFFIAISLALTLLLWSDWLVLLLRPLRHWPSPEDRPPGRLTAVYVVAVGLFTVMMAVLPPIDWDGLFYHLTAPKIFIQTHRISSGFDIPHFNFPFLLEMLFAYAMLLRGDIAAKLIHALYGLLLTGLVYLTARRHLSRESAWSAVLVFLSMPMVVTLAGWAYNDLALAFYQLAALYALLRWQVAGGRWRMADGGFEIPNPPSPTPDPPPPIPQ